MTVNFGSYGVEVVPSFLRYGTYYVPDTHDGGKWKLIDPKQEKTNLEVSNKRTNGNTIILIKMIKAWKSNWNADIKSLVIELTAIDFLNYYEYYDKSSVFYDWMVRDYFKYLLSKVSSSRHIPGTYEFINYGNSWESKVKIALSWAEKACDLETNGKHDEVTNEWRLIFGYRFPNP